MAPASTLYHHESGIQVSQMIKYNGSSAMSACARRWLSGPTVAGALLAGYLLTGFPPAQAQNDPVDTIGKREFIRYCAACHGEGGRGDGLETAMLLVKPPDLTSIRKRHGGEFPISWVYQIIDGRNSMRLHGSAEMPIWGDRYRLEALQGRSLPWNVSADSVVHGRILTLVFYLESIQED